MTLTVLFLRVQNFLIEIRKVNIVINQRYVLSCFYNSFNLKEP